MRFYELSQVCQHGPRAWRGVADREGNPAAPLGAERGGRRNLMASLKQT